MLKVPILDLSLEEYQRKARRLVPGTEFPLIRKQRSEPPKKKRVAGLMKGQIHMADDFDAPLDERFC
jgi:hypothetical protein